MSDVEIRRTIIQFRIRTHYDDSSVRIVNHIVRGVRPCVRHKCGRKGVDRFDLVQEGILKILSHGHARHKTADVGFYCCVFERALSGTCRSRRAGLGSPTVLAWLRT